MTWLYELKNRKFVQFLYQIISNSGVNVCKKYIFDMMSACHQLEKPRPIVM